jgi:hypothetical protein
MIDKPFNMRRAGVRLMVGLLLFPALVWGQSTNAPLSEEYYQLLDRYEIKQGRLAESFYSGFKPVQRRAIAEFVGKQLDSISGLNERDVFNLRYLANDNWEWSEQATVNRKPLLKYFYRHHPDLYSVDTEDFDLHVKPVLYLEGGVEAGEDSRPYINTRGVELRARINKKVGFYSLLTENQARFPGYVRERIREQTVVPGEGFYKGFKEGGVDFFQARGYVSFNPVQNINIQFGQDKFFIGNGQRSLLLSDVGNTYPFLKVQTQIWRFSYTNLFAELRGNFPGRRSNPYDIKKFLVLHHLSLNVTDNFNLGFFEALVSGDSLGNGFQPEYLNPVIFYRAIEHYAGSNTSNALVGMDAKWNFLNHFQVYGQFVLDEFLLAHMRERNGWWGNKWASQLGLKYVDALGIQNLDMQLEWNRARPFMYTHASGHTSYTHYLQALAHPLGANFDEKLLLTRFQPVKRLQLELQYLQALYGRDSLRTNVGSNILKEYGNRSGEFGHKIGQGVPIRLKIVQLQLSYMVAHRLYLDFKQSMRQLSTHAVPAEMDYFSTLGMRWNIGRRTHLF